jgi:hypothetical protein
MYSFTLENERGNQLAFNQLGGPYTIEEIHGLNPAPATINTSEVALLDGQQFNSAKVQMRTLSVAFAIEYDAAENRIAAFRVCRPKHKIRAYYVSETRDVYIDGYVQSVDVTYFDMKQVCTVTILCPLPYWRVAQAVIDEMSSVVPMFHFPFASTGTMVVASALLTEDGTPVLTESGETIFAGVSTYGENDGELVMGNIDMLASINIANNGEVETGIIIELQANGPVTNPKVYDYETGDFIGVNFTMQAGDLITINTMAGEKSVTLLRNGVTTNIFNSLMKGITWLQLPFGGGVYTHEEESDLPGNLVINICHFDLYEGV